MVFQFCFKLKLHGFSTRPQNYTNIFLSYYIQTRILTGILRFSPDWKNQLGVVWMAPSWFFQGFRLRFWGTQPAPRWDSGCLSGGSWSRIGQLRLLWSQKSKWKRTNVPVRLYHYNNERFVTRSLYKVRYKCSYDNLSRNVRDVYNSLVVGCGSRAADPFASHKNLLANRLLRFGSTTLGRARRLLANLYLYQFL